MEGGKKENGTDRREKIQCLFFLYIKGAWKKKFFSLIPITALKKVFSSWI